MSAATLFRICKVLDARVAMFLPESKAPEGKSAADPVLEELAQLAPQLTSEARKQLLDFARTLAPQSRKRARKGG